jgi:hypothetical protein
MKNFLVCGIPKSLGRKFETQSQKFVSNKKIKTTTIKYNSSKTGFSAYYCCQMEIYFQFS